MPRLQVGVGDAHERLTLAQDARESVVSGADRTKNGISKGYSQAGQAKHAKGIGKAQGEGNTVDVGASGR